MKQIIQALIKFQTIVPKIQFDKTNPHYKSKYSSLSGIIETINEALSKSDLTFTQTFEIREGQSILLTTLYHSSGEFIRSEMKMIEIQDPQKYGSCITYFKRYSLMAILGLSSVEEDDDANMAAPAIHKEQVKPQSDRPASQAQIKAVATWAAKNNIKIDNIDKLTNNQVQEYFKQMKPKEG